MAGLNALLPTAEHCGSPLAKLAIMHVLSLRIAEDTRPAQAWFVPDNSSNLRNDQNANILATLAPMLAEAAGCAPQERVFEHRPKE